MLKIKGEGLSIKPKALRGIVGYEFHPNLAVEGMLAFGVSDGSTDVDAGIPVNLSMKVEHAYGIYVKPKFDVTPQFEVFGRLGYAETKLKATVSALGMSASDSSSDGDFSYGLGVAYRFDPRMSVGLDYMRNYNKDGVKIDGVTLSLGYRF